MDFTKFGKQFTKQEAIAFHDSKAWEGWSYDQIVKFQLFQERLMIPFDIFHEAIEKVLDRPVFTHEFGLNYEGIVKEYLGEKAPPTFDEILNMIPKEKLLMIIPA